jgi:hypothetical protein
MKLPIETRWRGRWLWIARALWVALALAGAALFIAGLPVYFAQLQIVDACVLCGDQRLTPARLRELQSAGISVRAYAAYFVGIEVVFAALYALVASIIFWRRSDERQALFGAFMLLTWGLAFSNTFTTAVAAYPHWSLLINGITYIGAVSFVAFFCVFPSGRFTPRWTRWVILVWGLALFFALFLPDAPFSPTQWPLLLQTTLFLVVLGSVVIAQIIHYRRVSTQTQRQQTKWVVFGLAAALLGFLAVFVSGNLFPSLVQSLLNSVISVTAMQVFLLLIPLSIAFAILRSRLWDIDVIIRRTLVYSILTVALALLYVGFIVLLQQLTVPWIGGSEVALVASTLAIAALFTPLRQHLQTIIDKRFYRRKYDAAKVLAAFGVTVRDETDLDALTAELLCVADATMQPEHITMWLPDRPLRSTQDDARTDSLPPP